MTRKRLLRKRLSYRDQSGSDVAAHAAHWEGFTWQSGSVIVTSEGPWGQVQVWASSEEEGKRVIRHAASIAGFNPDDPSEGEWLVAVAPAGRNGQSANMGVMLNADGLAVSKREGPSGSARYVDPVA